MIVAADLTEFVILRNASRLQSPGSALGTRVLGISDQPLLLGEACPARFRFLHEIMRFLTISGAIGGSAAALSSGSLTAVQSGGELFHWFDEMA
jgi:hypothetical protein